MNTGTRRLSASSGRRRVARAGLLWLALAWLAGVIPAWTAEPPTLAEHQVKALYLYNFTRYVEWPTNAFRTDQSPFVIGLRDDSKVGESLREVVHSKLYTGRAFEVRWLTSEAEAKGCHLIYLGHGGGDLPARILAAVRDTPILTVTEGESQPSSSSTFSFRRKSDKLRIAVDLEAARRSGLTISAKLLAVAESVKGKPSQPSP